MSRLSLFAVAVALAGCSPGPVDMTSSCNGDQDSVCLPYAFAVATTATLSPAGLRPGDFGAMARLHVELQTCASMAPQHSVVLRAHATGASPLADGGSSDHIYTLAMVSDDGTHGDPVANDGVIDAVIPNPFDIDVPGGATVELSVTPHVGTDCGTAFTMPYTTGATCYFVPPMPPALAMCRASP